MSSILCGICDGLCVEDSVEKALLKHAARGHLRRLVATLDRGDCPGVNSARDENGRTPLHLAALGGHKECLKELLRRRADPNMSAFSIKNLANDEF